MKHISFDVSCCGDCPFFCGYTSDRGCDDEYFCSHPDLDSNNDGVIDDIESFPDWCPLEDKA